MKHGNLANYVGTTIGFRCIDCLFHYPQSGIKDKVLNFLVGKEKRMTVDNRVLDVMNFIYRQTEYNVDLVIERKDYTDELKKVLEHYPYNRIVLVDRMNHITMRLMTGDLTYYVDTDTIRLSQINSEYAVTLDDLSKYIRLRK